MLLQGAAEMKKKEFLRNVAIFSQLNDYELDLITKVVTEEFFAEGEEIVREGDEGDSMFIVYEGTVGISLSLTLRLHGAAESKEKVLTTLDSSMFPFFGEMALLGIRERTATCHANTPCKVLEITKKDFEKICYGHLNIGYRVMEKIGQVLCLRLQKANQDIKKLTTVLSLVMRKT